MFFKDFALFFAKENAKIQVFCKKPKLFIKKYKVCFLEGDKFVPLLFVRGRWGVAY